MFTRDKEGHIIMIEDSIPQEDTTIINIYAHNNRAPKYRKQNAMELKGEVNSSTIIGGFDTSLLIIE